MASIRFEKDGLKPYSMFRRKPGWAVPMRIGERIQQRSRLTSVVVCAVVMPYSLDVPPLAGSRSRVRQLFNYESCITDRKESVHMVCGGLDDPLEYGARGTLAARGQCPNSVMSVTVCRRPFQGSWQQRGLPPQRQHATLVLPTFKYLSHMVFRFFWRGRNSNHLC